MNINKRNFTGFQNIRLWGTNNNPSEVYFGTGGSGATPGSTAWDSTVAIVPIGGATVAANTTTDEVPYFNIANAGLNLGTGYIRIVPAGNATGNAGTLSVGTTYLDTDRAWQFPNKSGTFGISGTFSVDLPIIAAAGYLSTIVTISGIRTEDGLVIVPQKGAGASVSTRGIPYVGDVVPANGSATILLINPFATATVATTSVFAYTAVR